MRAQEEDGTRRTTKRNEGEGEREKGERDERARAADFAYPAVVEFA